ncbi:NAD(P)/FAD-dependent oxidoreductase [Acinetobacter sp. IK40]|jgi:cation diffusion facilitator CzcD-associated flavoprotein CzcO|uniref:flavin-containing monooxygenase n=1 Tax=Acinetobacter sp. IK40 TaxID=2928897 RepID=UPI002D1E5521|nr:NAD(P)/FAD-dependent oxidoreductase [Acinetobacter sp. IK40]MEB3792430.1 NAD(P)/FAD-dependent oxidoreductase [Acinetobacter sp. IK40]
MNKAVKPSKPTQLVDVLIIGAGPSGLSTCIKLKEQGIHNVVILDMANRIGGTWALNDYPSLFCDVPSEMYSLGFAPNPNWSRTYAPQAEIRQYLEDVAHQFNIVSQIQLSTEVTEARWDKGLNRWIISTADGKSYSAKFFVPATGFIGEAKMPSFPGQEQFKGTMFHSGKWNHEYDLTGKRVAVIGSGASAIQFLPAIQPKVGHLYSFQRTPSWVLPKPDFAVPNIVKTVFKKAPLLEKIIREGALWSLEPSLPVFMNIKIMEKLQALGKLNINLNIKDPEMRQAVTPTHTLGCKRPMFSNNWYAALVKPNVSVLFQGLSHITERGVVGEDGKEIQVDAIIFGTGYAVAEPAIYKIIKGVEGRSLSDTWQRQPRAYMGMSIYGFPNMFMMLGPNSQNTVGSVMWTAEQQSVYISKAIKLMQQRRIDYIEVKESVQKQFNARIDKRLAKMPVRADICKSYYLDDAGRNHIIWPEFGFVIKHKLHHVNLKDYRIESKVIKVVA